MILFFIILIFIIVQISIYATINKNKKPTTIIKTQIIGNNSQKSATSSIARGVVGGALFGAAGVVGGAVSGKNKNYTTFLVFYDDGTKTTKEAKNGSYLYNKLIQYLE